MGLSQAKSVAIAILYQQNQFLLQLRDPIPNIVYPGQWGFFGGHMEPGETPEIGLRRELVEEIGYRAAHLTCFGLYPSPGVVRHVFHGPLTVEIADLVLNEGWDLGLFTAEQIHRGYCYSNKAAQEQPLALPHRKILLDFIQARSNKQIEI